MRPRILLALLPLALLAGCKAWQPPTDTGWGVETRTQPPEDFWIGVTVMGPARASGSESDLPPRALRPARYVVEPDRVLRAAVGPGSSDQYFPAQTRRLSSADFAELWREAGRAGIIGTGGGGVPPAPDSIGPRTIYIIETHADGKRSFAIIEADPRCGPDCTRAKKVVEWLAGRAWVAKDIVRP